MLRDSHLWKYHVTLPLLSAKPSGFQGTADNLSHSIFTFNNQLLKILSLDNIFFLPLVNNLKPLTITHMECVKIMIFEVRVIRLKNSNPGFNGFFNTRKKLTTASELRKGKAKRASAFKCEQKT